MYYKKVNIFLFVVLNKKITLLITKGKDQH